MNYGRELSTNKIMIQQLAQSDIQYTELNLQMHLMIISMTNVVVHLAKNKAQMFVLHQN